MGLSGQLLAGYPITVALTQSEKNKKSPEEEKSMRLYVGGLPTTITEADLTPVFEAFGPLDGIDLHIDAMTQANKGFGFVQFKKADDAKQALEVLDGMEIAGTFMKVGLVEDKNRPRDPNAPPAYVAAGGHAMEKGDSTQHISGMNQASRIALMQKLMGQSVPSPAVNLVKQALVNLPMQPTSCLVVKNMFTPQMVAEDDEFDLDIKEDVEDECEKFRQAGKLEHIFVDKNSAGFVYLRFDTVAAAKQVPGPLLRRCSLVFQFVQCHNCLSVCSHHWCPVFVMLGASFVSRKVVCFPANFSRIRARGDLFEQIPSMSTSTVV